MSVARTTGSKSLAFTTALMVVLTLVVPLVGIAGASHTSADPTRVSAGPDDSAPANTCNAFTISAFGNPGDNAPAEGETVDVRATQSDADTNQDLQIEFCDPDGTGPGSNLGGGFVDPASGAQTGNSTTPGRDCDDDVTFSVDGAQNAACTGGTGGEQPASIHDECTMDANGTCTFGITSNEAGTMNVRVFFDTNGNDVHDTGEPFDDAVKTWTAGAGAGRNITCVPATDSNPDGSRHEFRCTVTDANGTAVPNATVTFDVTAGPNSEEVGRTNCGNAPTGTDTTGTASPAGSTTDASGQTAAPATENPAGSGQVPGNTAACGYNDNLQGAANSPLGTDTIVAWVNLPSQPGQAAPTSGPDAGEAQTTIQKTWVGSGRTIDCEPETATNQVGTSHVVTCTVRDRNGQPVQGVLVDLTLISGFGTMNPASGVDQTTNASGQVTATISTTVNDATGTSTIRGEIKGQADDLTECGTAAGTPAGAPAGVCFDDVTKTWTRQGPPQCNDNVDNDGDGLIDFGNDPGCASVDDNSESPDPGGPGDQEFGGEVGQDVTSGPCAGFTTGSVQNRSGGGLVIVGTNGPDALQGGNNADLICGLGADDTIQGHGGGDTIYGNGGKDAINGDDGNDQLFGNNGKDVIIAGAGDDRVSGGRHNDNLGGGDGNDTVLGQGGWDTLKGNSGNDLLDGSGGNDILQGGGGNDVGRGGGGDDVIKGFGGRDRLIGAGGNDIIRGSAGNDILKGGKGDDVLNGGGGTDRCRPGSGSDVVRRCER